MSYTIGKFLTGTAFENAETRTRKALEAEGFGVLTEIDVQATMKKKLDAAMPRYLILGACNPQMAHKAIGMEPDVGAMLPCNVILRETEDGVQVSAVDPQASMAAIDNDELKTLAGDVRERLEKAVQSL